MYFSILYSWFLLFWGKCDLSSFFFITIDIIPILCDDTAREKVS